MLRSFTYPPFSRFAGHGGNIEKRERGGRQMSMVRRDAFSDLTTSWQRDIERLFRSVAESLGGSEGIPARTAEWIPAIDVVTRGDDLVVRLDMPGIDPDKDLEITAEDGTLRIRGERQETDER